jgi:hypothetical protein
MNMNKFIIILMAAIWAFGLILLPQSAETEMSALTDEEMEEARVNIWNLSLTLTVHVDLESERDDLFDDMEETKLDTHLQESSSPDSKEIEHISHRWERVTPSGRTFGFDNADLTILTRELDIHKH